MSLWWIPAAAIAPGAAMAARTLWRQRKPRTEWRQHLSAQTRIPNPRKENEQ